MPEIQKSDDFFKDFDLNDRNCYFEGERKLKYFKIYTQRNCQNECYSQNGEFCRFYKIIKKN